MVNIEIRPGGAGTIDSTSRRARPKQGGRLGLTCGPTLALALLVTSVGTPATVMAQQAANSEPDDTSTTARPAEVSEVSSTEALRAYSRAATYQNNRAFDLAAESWQDFIRQYPQDPKVVEAYYHLGVCYLELKEFAKAKESLQRALEDGRDFDRKEDALLNLGWATYTLALPSDTERFAEAEQVFARLLAEFPDGEHRDQALFLMGESRYMQGQREKAAESYRELVSEHDDSDLLNNGLYAYGVTLEELGRFDEAAQVYDRFLAAAPDDPLATEVLMRKAETILQRGDPAAAERLFAQVADVEGFAQAEHARFRQAYCVARQDRFGEAAELFAAIAQGSNESRYRQEAQMSAARAFFRAERFGEASSYLEPLIDSDDPIAIEAAHWQARVSLKTGRPEEALQIVDRVLPKAVSSDHPFTMNLYMDRADAMYELPDRKRQAYEQYMQLARENPDHLQAPQALYNAAFAALELKEFQPAVQLAKDFLAKYPEHRLVPDVKRVEAEGRLQLGEANAAADIFAQIVADDPQNATAVVLRQAVALNSQKKHNETLALLSQNRALFREPDSRAEALHLAGLAYQGLQRFDRARQSLLAALSAQPNWARADETLLNLAQCERSLGNLSEARTTAERLLAEHPDTDLQDQATYRLGEYCYALEDYPAAAENYGWVVQKAADSPFAPFALQGLGWTELRQSNADAAEAAFTQLLARYPRHSLADSTYYARALARQQVGEFQEAMSDLTTYLQSDRTRRETSDALYVKGLCFAGQNKAAEAISTLNRIVEEDPDYHAMPKVLYELAWAYRANGEPKSAVKTFADLAERYHESPFGAESWYHVGESRYQAEDFEQAAVAYRQAAEGIDDSSDLAEKIYYKLGWAEYQREQYQPALDAFSRQLEIRPDGDLSGDAWFMSGECLFKLAKYQEALAAYTQAGGRELSSEQMTILAHLHAGQAAAQLQRWEESLEWLDEVRQTSPDSPLQPQIAFESAVAQQNLGHLTEAARLFSAIAEHGSGELAARARFMLGEVLYAQKEYVEAIREFRKVMFGFDASIEPAVASWQAKAGFEAGQCAGVLAGQQTSRAERQKYLEIAAQFFEYVRARHQDSQEAVAAAEQLQRYGRLP